MPTAKKPTKKAPKAPTRRKRKPNAARSATQRAKDLELTARLYLKGLYQADIAKEVGVSLPTIKRDLAEIRSIWLESSIRDFDEAKAQELARIDLVEAEAWEAWADSKGSTTTKRKEEKEATQFPGTNEIEITQELNGDPRYLQVVLVCVERRSKLLGLNAPEKVAPTDPTGKKPYDPPPRYEEAELDARIAELQEKLGLT